MEPCQCVHEEAIALTYKHRGMFMVLFAVLLTLVGGVFIPWQIVVQQGKELETIKAVSASQNITNIENGKRRDVAINNMYSKYDTLSILLTETSADTKFIKEYLLNHYNKKL